jgi:hypothetical protein
LIEQVFACISQRVATFKSRNPQLDARDLVGTFAKPERALML